MLLKEEEASKLTTDNCVDYILKEVLTIAGVNVYDTFDEAILPVMSGKSLLLIDGISRFVVLDTIGFPDRGIPEPETEVLIRGPRDGYNETLHVNTMLLRRRIKDPNLTIQMGEVGRRGKSKFAICYIKGIVSPSLVEEVRYRISCIDIDEVPETEHWSNSWKEMHFHRFPNFCIPKGLTGQQKR